MARESGGVQALVFTVYVYDDHSRLAVTRRDYLPRTGDDRRIGAIRLDVGRQDISGLAPYRAVAKIADAILRGKADPSSLNGSA